MASRSALEEGRAAALEVLIARTQHPRERDPCDPAHPASCPWHEVMPQIQGLCFSDHCPIGQEVRLLYVLKDRTYSIWTTMPVK
jgi:hypothetical protein